MKKYKAILFDMDGTLVPMNMKEFTYGYFKFLCKKLEKFGIEDDKLIAAIWKGTAAMVQNDGNRNNEAVFWECFAKQIEGPIDEIHALCDDYYGNEFHQAKQFTKDNPLATEAVTLARKIADKVVLATNPLFPMVGQVSRMGWVGLKPEDFDLVTSYESDSFCKPNPKYFASICERIGVLPEECLVIGNDENEDMYCCSQLGMDGYLVTDTMIPCEEHPWTGERGTFAEMVEMLKKCNCFE